MTLRVTMVSGSVWEVIQIPADGLSDDNVLHGVTDPREAMRLLGTALEHGIPVRAKRDNSPFARWVGFMPTGVETINAL